MGRRRQPTPTPAPTPTPPPAPVGPITLIGTDRDETLGGDFDIAQIIFGLGGNDVLRGRTKVDQLDGGDGRDFIFDGDFAADLNALGGRGANDVLCGGAGDDVLTSNFGADIVDGGAGLDFAFVSLSAVTTPLMVSGAFGSGQTLTLANGTSIIDIEGLNLTLGIGSDIVRLTGGDLILNTGAGNDDVVTGDGRDSIYTQAGADLVRSGGGNDLVDGAGGDDRLEGEAGNDVLRGGDQNDWVDGGLGDDVLSGENGTDTLIGGEGADIFDFNGQSGIDRILDFDRSEGDLIRASFIDGNPEDGGQIIADPIAAGVIQIVDTAEGAVVRVVNDPTSGLLLVGIAAAAVTSDFFIVG